MISRVKQLAPPLVYRLTNHPDSFLSHVQGVIHVGANTGQERLHYKRFGLRVLWIEPIPWVFAELLDNISGFNRQVALEALVTNVDGQTYRFHVANNKDQSSSILDLKDHRKIWPDVEYSQEISVSGVTLPSLLKREGYESRDYQALVMDTQGSEMLVLQGSVPILNGFNFIKTEVAD